MAQTNLQTVIMNLTLPLSEHALKFLHENSSGEPADQLARWVAYWLDLQARGGLMLDPAAMEHLTKLNGKKFANVKEIVQLVEKALKREDGQMTFQIAIDPAWHAPLKEIAEQQGTPIEEMMQRFVNEVVSEAWGFGFSPERVARFTQQQWDEIRAIVGKDGEVFGADILDCLKRAKGRKAA